MHSRKIRDNDHDCFNKPMVKPHADICQTICSLTMKSAMVHSVKNIAVRTAVKK